MPRNTGGHSFLATSLASALNAQCGHLGFGLSADAEFIVSLPGPGQDIRLSPDACFVRRERAPDRHDFKAFYGSVWRVAPDLVAEVVSTNDKAKGVHAKAQKWLAAGVKLVWVLWPMHRRIEVWEPGDQTPSQVLGMADVLDGGEVIPFALPVQEIF